MSILPKKTKECIQKLEELHKQIGRTSLLINYMEQNGKCPFCNSDIGTMKDIEVEHIQSMQEWNKLGGTPQYKIKK